MAARTLEQVISELQGTYQPQIDTLRQRQAAIPGQIATEEQGLQAKQEQSFGDILNGSRRRGLGFSGIPLSEQARYTSTEFLPAMARLRQSGQERAMSLEDAINGILERRNTLGQQLVSQSQAQDLEERKFAEQQRRYNEQLAQQRSGGGNGGGFSPSLGGGSPANNKTGGSATAAQRGDKGFNFTDAAGRPISAASYAAAKGISFRALLEQMAGAGDAGARDALGFVGDDLGYDPRKVDSDARANLYNNLVWGTGRTAYRANGGGGGGGGW